MATAERLSENLRQGFEVQKPACIGLEGDLGRNLRWGCGHIYDETPVGIAVYVRNDPVNLVDPDGRQIVYPESHNMAESGWLSSMFGASYVEEDFWHTYMYPLQFYFMFQQFSSVGGRGSSGGAPTINSSKGAFWNWGRFTVTVL
jgi:hypothetical protein